MKILHSKMTTEELAQCLGIAKQTVNRWIREQGWQTETIPGVKGGRARLVHIDHHVREYLANTPALRRRSTQYQLAEPVQNYVVKEADPALRQIADILQVMTDAEKQRLVVLLSREGISGFMARLGIADAALS
ncbi:putative DNA-binding transcriptional regulator [Trabulsiella odontotermitis]|uniref:YfeC-like transcriptional regulator n=1 Tax=Trabulsiella odontotermitis TaxID=379893 RepID=UPI0024B6FFE8|nr:YfeC-like transcriptional regulator [Trabulsiella odontotermitis]WHP32655.1 putative DNA-binding transcriptional regulator [Trabulsiella odontotermitis]